MPQTSPSPKAAHQLRPLDHVQDPTRAKQSHRSIEKASVHWIDKYILFHDKRTPRERAEVEIRRFLTRPDLSSGIGPSNPQRSHTASES